MCGQVCMYVLLCSFGVSFLYMFRCENRYEKRRYSTRLKEEGQTQNNVIESRKTVDKKRKRALKKKRYRTRRLRHRVKERTQREKQKIEKKTKNEREQEEECSTKWRRQRPVRSWSC